MTVDVTKDPTGQVVTPGRREALASQREGPLRGRGLELEQLRRGIDAARDGRSHVVFVEGEAGSGKTRLLTEALHEAGTAGLLVLWAACEEFERSRPFAALAAALDLKARFDEAGGSEAELVASMSQVIGGRRGRPRRDLDHHVIEAALNLIDRLSTDRSVALVLDDLQWADPSTLEALGALARRLRHHPVLLIGSTRPSPRPRELERVIDVLLRDRGVHLRLAPLDPEAAARLAADTVSATVGASLLEQVGAAGGSPLYIIELIRALQDDGAIEVSDGRAEARASSLPPTLRLTIVRRLSALPRETLDVLRVSAVLGSSFSLRHLSLLSGRSAVELMTALEPALRTGVVGDAGETLRFRHDLVREAIYEDLPVAIRKAIHADAGRKLASAAADVSEVFEHVSLGAIEGDEDALTWLESAATARIARAPRLAIEMLERALSIAPADPARGHRIEVSLMQALSSAGRLSDAEALGWRLLGEGIDRQLEARVRDGIGRSLFHQGKFHQAAEQLDRAVERYDLPIERARCLAWAALASTFVNSADAEDRVEVALEVGRTVGDDAAMVSATTALASWKTNNGYLSEGAEVARHAGQLAHNVWRGESMEALPSPVVHLLRAGWLEEAEQILQTGLWSEEELGWGFQPQWHVMLGLRRFLGGNWDDAVAESETALELANEVGSQWNMGTALSVLSCVAIHRNDLEAAGRYEATLRRGHHEETPWASALLLAARSNTDGLRSLLESLRGSLSTTQEMYCSPWFSARDWVRLYLDTGDAETARALTAGAEELARRADVPGTTGDALYCRGLVEGDLESLVESVTWFRRSPTVLGLAEACEAAGVALARAGRTAEALPLITEAQEVYERLDAHRDVSRIEAAFRGLGLRRGHRGSRRRPSVGWESLTPAELKVVQLTNQGLTYREVASALYVSKRTVETHAAHIFRKLGISTRRELQEISKRVNDETQ